MDVPRKLAIVEFQHGLGCTRGQPYGECNRNCDWRVVKIVSAALAQWELNTYGVEPKEWRF